MNIMSRFGLTTVVVLLLLQLPEFEPFGFGGSSAPLYSKSDKGITLINYSNFESTIINSTYSWMVEFYSSWCGHCIRFAPTFKQLGEHVKGKGHHIDRCTDLYFESGETSFYKKCTKQFLKDQIWRYTKVAVIHMDFCRFSKFASCSTRISKVGKCAAFQLWTPMYF